MEVNKMKRLIRCATVFALCLAFSSPVLAAEPPGDDERSRFYDFSDQLIDGEIRRPTALYTDARQRAQFDRLLRLKKSFLPAMWETSRERVFK